MLICIKTGSAVKPESRPNSLGGSIVFDDTQAPGLIAVWMNDLDTGQQSLTQYITPLEFAKFLQAGNAMLLEEQRT